MSPPHGCFHASLCQRSSSEVPSESLQYPSSPPRPVGGRQTACGAIGKFKIRKILARYVSCYFVSLIRSRLRRANDRDEPEDNSAAIVVVINSKHGRPYELSMTTPSSSPTAIQDTASVCSAQARQWAWEGQQSRQARSPLWPQQGRAWLTDCWSMTRSPSLSQATEVPEIQSARSGRIRIKTSEKPSRTSRSLQYLKLIHSSLLTAP